MASKDLIVFLRSESSCDVYNVETQDIKEFPELPIKCNDPGFFEQLFSIVHFRHIKAFVFGTSANNFTSFTEEFKFRLKCCEFAQKFGIFCYIPHPFHEDAFAAISQTKTMLKEGEEILVVDSVLKGTPPVYVMLKREIGYYRITDIGISNCPAFSPSWKNDILGSRKPKAIILIQNKPHDPNAAAKMKKLFKGEIFKSVFINNPKMESITTNAEKVQHLMGEKISEYYIKDFCTPEIEVRIDENVLISAYCTDTLPLEKSVVIDVNSKKCVSLYCSNSEFDVVLKTKRMKFAKEYELSTFKCKKVTVTLKIDINSFYDLKIESIEDEKEEVDVTKANSNVAVEKLLASERARMIFDRQNFAVSYFSNNKETILADSDGLNKTPIYISFAEKKPIFGKDALYAYVENSKSVVFDLIKLCSIENADIKNPNWDFKLSQENDTIIVTMQTVDGEKKSTVDFLLALILKNGNDRIKKAYGRRMKEIEIGFDGFVPNEMLKKNFIEAGKLLNVNIVFG